MKKVGRLLTKGINKNVIKNNIKHEDYKNVQLNNEQLHHKMKTIRSQKHQLGSYEINKVSLSCFDNKCYIRATLWTLQNRIDKRHQSFIKYRPPYFWTRYRFSLL